MGDGGAFHATTGLPPAYLPPIGSSCLFQPVDMRASAGGGLTPAYRCLPRGSCIFYNIPFVRALYTWHSHGKRSLTADAGLTTHAALPRHAWRACSPCSRWLTIGWRFLRLTHNASANAPCRLRCRQLLVCAITPEFIYRIYTHAPARRRVYAAYRAVLLRYAAITPATYVVLCLLCRWATATCRLPLQMLGGDGGRKEEGDITRR